MARRMACDGQHATWYLLKEDLLGSPVPVRATTYAGTPAAYAAAPASWCPWRERVLGHVEMPNGFGHSNPRPDQTSAAARTFLTAAAIEIDRILNAAVTNVQEVNGSAWNEHRLHCSSGRHLVSCDDCKHGMSIFLLTAGVSVRTTGAPWRARCVEL